MWPRMRTCRAYQLAAEPLSAAIMQLSGAWAENSLKILIGLTGSASTWASASITSHQRCDVLDDLVLPGAVLLAFQQRDERAQGGGRHRRRG